MDKDIEKKIDELEKRISKAREDSDDIFEEDEGAQNDDTSSAARGADIGYMFLALVISGWLLGLGIDRFFGVAPWGMIIMTVMGLVAGVFRANHEMKKNR